MALEVEDGTGKPDAEAYISVADASAYFVARSVSAWTEVADKEAALRLATDYMQQIYGGRWKGAKVSPTQALDWPRDGVMVDGYEVPADAVPVEIQRACAELAVRSASAPLSADQGPAVKSETVGPLSVTYADSAVQRLRYVAVDNLLARFMRGGAGMQIPVVRA